MFLRPYQQEAVDKLESGNILVGNVGSGKSRTGLYWYFKENGGSIDDKYHEMKNPKDLYIITTARKRDNLEWNKEISYYRLTTDPSTNLYNNKIVIDSWQNIKKYKDVRDSYFLFDEDHLTGTGEWVKTFWHIVKPERNNRWIVLTATPGDSYKEYAPIFVANGFFKNITQFRSQHVVYDYHASYPKVVRYMNTARLDRMRRAIVVKMKYKHEVNTHNIDILVDYDQIIYKSIVKTQMNPFTKKPIANASEYCVCLRKVVNSHPSRLMEIKRLAQEHRKIIVFYNHNYELELLKSIDYGPEFTVAELNGLRHEGIPETTDWVYLVNYNAGAEAWECTSTDTIVFYSLNYSYKIMTQSAGRIDRLNTPYSDLYYYRLKSSAPIDIAIQRALREKKTFNEKTFMDIK